MRRLFLALAVAFAAPVNAQLAGSWFSVQGDSTEDDIEGAELNLDGFAARGQIKLMELRVNLRRARTMQDGEKYTSYFSHIAIDCKASSIFHIDQRRFSDAKWSGNSTFQEFTNTRPMAFGGFKPSPKPLILRAACPSTPG